MDVSSNGAIFVGSNSGGFGIANANDMLILKVSSGGDLDWALMIGGVGSNGARNVLALDDGGVLVLGATTGFGEGSYDGIIAKISENGQVLVSKTIGGSGFDELFDI